VLNSLTNRPVRFGAVGCTRDLLSPQRIVDEGPKGCAGVQFLLVITVRRWSPGSLPVICLVLFH